MLRVAGRRLVQHLGLAHNGPLYLSAELTARLSTAAQAGDDETRRALVNKLLYRSKQRGWLELDLLVGMWAEREIPKMDMPALQQLSQLLDQENPDLFKWLTGQLESPEELRSNTVFMALKNSVQQQMAENAPLKSRAAAGATWVRGWDDMLKQTPTGTQTPAR